MSSDKPNTNDIYRGVAGMSRLQRMVRFNQMPCVIWFTGLSGAGKSTLASALEVELYERNYTPYLLDGDDLRHGLNKDLGFSDADRTENIRRAGEVSALMMDAGLIVLAAFISPFHQERKIIRDLISTDHFIEIYVSTPLSICEQRDVKGLYKKARAGVIKNFTGIDSVYEPPLAPEIAIDTSVGSLAEHVEYIIKYMTARGFLHEAV